MLSLPSDDRPEILQQEQLQSVDKDGMSQHESGKPEMTLCSSTSISTIAACNAQSVYTGEQKTHIRFPYYLPMREKVPPLASFLPAKLLIYRHDASPCVKSLAGDSSSPQACSSALAGSLSIERTPRLCHTDIPLNSFKVASSIGLPPQRPPERQLFSQKTLGRDSSASPSGVARTKPNGFQCPVAGLPMASTSPAPENPPEILLVMRGLVFKDCRGFATCVRIGPLGMRSTWYLNALHYRICMTTALISLRVRRQMLWCCHVAG